MNVSKEKLDLLLDMISFSVVDGKLDPKEYQFLSLIASDLNIDKATFDDLFHLEQNLIVPKTENQRIQQFYRLALLMHIDGEAHAKEEQALYEIGLKMGLNPTACKRILKLMAESDYKILTPELILSTFRQQHN